MTEAHMMHEPQALGNLNAESNFFFDSHACQEGNALEIAIHSFHHNSGACIRFFGIKEDSFNMNDVLVRQMSHVERFDLHGSVSVLAVVREIDPFHSNLLIPATFQSGRLNIAESATPKRIRRNFYIPIEMKLH